MTRAREAATSSATAEDAGDDQPCPGRVVAFEIYDDGRQARLWRRQGTSVDAIEASVRPVRYVADETLATHASVAALTDLLTPPGDGYRFVLRARQGVGQSDLALALDGASEELDLGDPRDERALLRPLPERDLMVESGLRLFQGVPFAELRVVAIHLSIHQLDLSEDWRDSSRRSNRLVAVHLYDSSSGGTETHLADDRDVRRLWQRVAGTRCTSPVLT